MDQASGLRGMMEKAGTGHGASPFILAVTSGKGGVGKTNVVVNLSCSLARLGLRVLVLDADVGLGNIDILLGLTPTYNIQHVLDGRFRAADILVEGPSGIKILPSSSGVQELTDLSPDQKMGLASELESILDGVDVFLIDTGAGISSNVMYFNAMAQEVMLVVTPEPTSITDAYALMKVSSMKYSGERFKILLNLVKNKEEAYQVYNHLSMVVQRFLNVSLEMCGYIPLDQNIVKAVRRQQAVVEGYPQSPASRQFQQLALKVKEDAGKVRLGELGRARMFWRSFLDDSRDAR
jgi:flagellar biosynthesis protein FlhG